MKKRFLMAIFASLALLTAACGSNEESGDVKNSEAAQNEESDAEKEAAEKEAKEKAEKEAAEKAEKEAAEQAEAGEVVNHAQRYLEQVPKLTINSLTLSDVSFNYINENPELFPTMTDADIDKMIELTDTEVTSEQLYEDVTPYLDKIVNLAGDVIQIEQGTLEDGTPLSLILIEDMDFNPIYCIGYFGTDFVEGDFADVWGLPLGTFDYIDVDGETVSAQALAISHIE